jgi:8-oxo-dGTP pyrophosphatase MutT (NUDIX family)/DNA topoisomerase IB
MIQNIINRFFKKSKEKQQYADVIVKNQDGKVLLLHRGFGEGFEAGKWSLPGGHVDSNEDPCLAASRELQEETGIVAQVRPLEVKEKGNAIIFYYEASVLVDGGDVILDNNEHRSYEWVEEEELCNYDLICDLKTYIGDLLSNTMHIAKLSRPAAYTNIEESIAEVGEDLTIEQAWTVLCKAFDNGKISEEQFFKAKRSYEKAKIKEAKDTIAKAFDLGMISEEKYLEAIMKGGDPSHGGKLVKKIIIDANRKKTTKWVDKTTGKEAPKAVTQHATGNEWWSSFKQYSLNCYPLGIDKSKVDINETGDVNSHWILRWKDPKSGMWKNAYSKEFMNRNAEAKWKRIQNVKAGTISNIKDKSALIYMSEKFTHREREAAAIINIIAHTGLRRGDKLKFEKTGNRGISSLGPDNIEIKGSNIKFNFTGKSYQENNAQIDDPSLAKYLTKVKAGAKGQEFLFNTTDSEIDEVFDKVGGEGLKIKDMRTYVATDLARKLLFEDKAAPPPVPDVAITKQKKLIQDKLKNVYEKVAEKLCNTPTMAKNSYIHPNILTLWIKGLNVKFDIKKSESESGGMKQYTLDEMLEMFPIRDNIGEINEEDEDECDMFNEPEELLD